MLCISFFHYLSLSGLTSYLFWTLTKKKWKKILVVWFIWLMMIWLLLFFSWLLARRRYISCYLLVLCVCVCGSLFCHNIILFMCVQNVLFIFDYLLLLFLHSLFWRQSRIDNTTESEKNVLDS